MFSGSKGGLSGVALRSLAVSAVLFLGVGSAFEEAEAQCVRATVIKGKVKLGVIPVSSWSGQCPSGTVSMAAGPKGPQGPQGAQGPQGPQGPAGANGASAFGTIPSGVTVRGVIGNVTAASPGWIEMHQSLPAPAPAPIDPNFVIVKANPVLFSRCPALACLDDFQKANQYLCTGTSSKPTAAPGAVCIYPTFVTEEIFDSGLVTGVTTTDSGQPTNLGFFISMIGKRETYQRFRGVWAYTAP